MEYSLYNDDAIDASVVAEDGQETSVVVEVVQEDASMDTEINHGGKLLRQIRMSDSRNF